MTEDRHDVLDELGAALDIAPSADFEARVRERIARAPARRPNLSWIGGPIAVGALMWLVAVSSPDTDMPTATRVAQDYETAVPSTREALAPGPDPIVTNRPVERRETSSSRHESNSSQILLPEGQANRLHRLIAEVNAQRISLAPPLPQDAEIKVLALAAPDPISSELIKIDPLSMDAPFEVRR